MRIALTGATGFVGGAVLNLAAERGHVVRALTRRPQRELGGVEWQEGDLATPAALDQLVTGTDAVIHLAGTVSSTDRAAFADGNVTGTRELLRAVHRAGPPRLIFVSSLAAREPGLSAYGASKAAAEELVGASGLDWTIVRPPAVYGPGDAAMLDLFRAARWGLVPMPRGGRASLIHVADLARLLLTLAEAGEGVLGTTYEPDDGRPEGWPHREFARELGRAVGRKARAIDVSPRMLRWAARADTALRGSKAKLTADRAGYMAHPDWVVSPADAPPPGLWRPEVPTPEGLRATARWYREQGWL